jgi:phosphoglycolate phosphatase
LNTRRFDAALFDLDGTLLDTLEDLADSMNAVLAARGLPVHPSDAYRYFVGDGVGNLVRRALPEASRDEATVPRIAAEMRRAYRERWDAKTKPYDGIEEMLEGLRAAGVRLAVLSNKPEDFTILCVEKMLDAGRFEIIRGARDGVPRKPDPIGAVEIAAAMDLPPGRFLYVGDTNTDMQTAVAAGMYAVGVSWGFRPAEELRENGAQTIVDRPADVVGLLG